MGGGGVGNHGCDEKMHENVNGVGVPGRKEGLGISARVSPGLDRGH